MKAVYLVVAIIVFFASVAFGIYDNSQVDVIVGGHGVSVSNTVTGGRGRTYIAAGYPIRTACTVTSIKFVIYGNPTQPTAANLQLLRPSGSDYIVVESVSILPEIAAAPDSGYHILTKSGLSWAAQAGDCVGIYHAASSNRLRNFNAGQTARLKFQTGSFNVDDVIVSPSAESTFACNVEVFGTTNEYIILDDNNGGSGFVKDDIINIPAFEDDPYYIILEKIENVANAEDLSIVLDYTDTDGSEATAETLLLDFAADTISLVSGGDSDVLTEVTGSQITAHIWVDPVNNKIEVMYVNYKYGQGGRSYKDIKHISITDRVPASLLANKIIKRIKLTQSAGTGAAVDRIVVTRKPILAIGDSFVSGYTTETILAHVGARLDDASGVFTEARYVINGGITGGQMVGDPRFMLSAVNRWNSTDGDMIAFRDVVVTIIGGTNDLGELSTVEAEMRSKVARLIGFYGKIAGEALDDGDGGRNDVILCQFIPYNPDDVPVPNPLHRKQAKELVNGGLVQLGYAANIPLARVYLAYSDGWSGAHADAAGDLWIAQTIAEAYEKNRVPSNPSRPEPEPDCINHPKSDTNGDCQVDFIDLATFNAEWLDCGYEDANDCN